MADWFQNYFTTFRAIQQLEFTSVFSVLSSLVTQIAQFLNISTGLCTFKCNCQCKYRKNFGRMFVFLIHTSGYAFGFGGKFPSAGRL